MATAPSLEDITKELLGIIRVQLRLGDEFTAESGLAASGMDSLGMVRILAAIEELYGLWLEGDALTPETLKNTGTLAACLHQQLLAQQTG